MLRLDDAWVWDFWLAHDEGAGEHHLFFLTAPREDDPDARHWVATVGHAVSTDLRTWRPLAPAFGPSPAPAIDDVATWTGSCVRGPDGRWHLFYTGLSRTAAGYRQQVTVATSDDLVHWHRDGRPVTMADPRWYESLDDAWEERPGHVPHEHWRDPWVFPDPDGDGWHMLVTAHAREGERNDRGVVGHARSGDLRTWEVQPPLSEPGSGFGQLEVLQVEVIDGRPALIFSCLAGDLPRERREPGFAPGTWSLPADSLTGPFDLTRATPLTDDRLYSGRVVTDGLTGGGTDGVTHGGTSALLAFRNRGDDGFVGELSDPLPLRWVEAAPGSPRLALAEPF